MSGAFASGLTAVVAGICSASYFLFLNIYCVHGPERRAFPVHGTVVFIFGCLILQLHKGALSCRTLVLAIWRNIRSNRVNLEYINEGVFT